jgi:hypothetical protein
MAVIVGSTTTDHILAIGFFLEPVHDPRLGREPLVVEGDHDLSGAMDPDDKGVSKRAWAHHGDGFWGNLVAVLIEDSGHAATPSPRLYLPFSF